MNAPLITEANWQRLDADRRAIRRVAREKRAEQLAIIEAAEREIRRINWEAEMAERALEKAFDPFAGLTEQRRAA